MISGSRTFSDASVARTTRTTSSPFCSAGSDRISWIVSAIPYLSGCAAIGCPPFNGSGVGVQLPTPAAPFCSQLLSFFANMAIFRLPPPFRQIRPELDLRRSAGTDARVGLFSFQQKHEDPGHRRRWVPRQSASQRTTFAAQAAVRAGDDAP